MRRVDDTEKNARHYKHFSLMGVMDRMSERVLNGSHFLPLRKSRIALGKTSVSGLFSKSGQRYVGIDIGSHAIKVVELSRAHGAFRLDAYAIEALAPLCTEDQTGADPKSVAQALTMALERAGVVAREAVVAVADTQVIGKTFEVQAGLSQEELELHVWLEAEQYLPYALEDAALDFEVQEELSINPGQVSVLLVACRQETLAWYQALLSCAGLQARVIDVQTHALARAVLWMPSPALQASGAVAVVEFATETTLLSIVQQGHVTHSRQLLFGAGEPCDEIFRALAVEHLSDGLEQIAGYGNDRPVASIMLAGTGASRPGLDQWIETQLGLPACVANPFAFMDLDPALAPEALFCDAPMLLTAFGLALRGFD